MGLARPQAGNAAARWPQVSMPRSQANTPHTQPKSALMGPPLFVRVWLPLDPHRLPWRFRANHVHKVNRLEAEAKVTQKKLAQRYGIDDVRRINAALRPSANVDSTTRRQRRRATSQALKTARSRVEASLQRRLELEASSAAAAAAAPTGGFAPDHVGTLGQPVPHPRPRARARARNKAAGMAKSFYNPVSARVPVVDSTTTPGTAAGAGEQRVVVPRLPLETIAAAAATHPETNPTPDAAAASQAQAVPVAPPASARRAGARPAAGASRAGRNLRSTGGRSGSQTARAAAGRPRRGGRRGGRGRRGRGGGRSRGGRRAATARSRASSAASSRVRECVRVRLHEALLLC